MIEAIANIGAATTAELLMKMTVWTEAAPDASPDADCREPSDTLAYSVYLDLAAIEREAGG